MFAKNSTRGREERVKQVQEKTSRVDPKPSSATSFAASDRLHLYRHPCERRRRRSTANARARTRFDPSFRPGRRERFEKARATIAFGDSERRELSWKEAPLSSRQDGVRIASGDGETNERADGMRLLQGSGE